MDSLQALQRSVQQWDDIITFQAAYKFDPSTRRDWERYLKDGENPPTVKQLKDFIKSQNFTLESMESSGKPWSNNSRLVQEKSTSSSRGTNAQASHHSQTSKKSDSSQKSTKCFCCNGAHNIYGCEAFRSASERRSIAADSGRCFNCLGSHFIKDCKSPRTCSQCRQKHNSLLHSDQPGINVSQQSDYSSQRENTLQHSSGSLNSTHVTSVFRLLRSGVLLATAKIHVQGPNGVQFVARALIDSGSQPSLI